MNFRMEMIEYGKWKIADGAEEIVVEADAETRIGRQRLTLKTFELVGDNDAVARDLASAFEAIVKGATSFGPTVAVLRAEAAAVAWEAANPTAPVPILTRMDTVTPCEVAWLWPGRVPLGRITLMVGRGGEGKSFVATDLAARVSRGFAFPDGAPCPVGSVLLIAGEDDPADTIAPRLIAHGADLSRITLLAGTRLRQSDGGKKELWFTLNDLGILEAALDTLPDCRLVIVDPIGSFIGGKVDSDKDNAVRGVLAPFAKLLERRGAAGLIIAHRRKSGAEFADDVALGSRAFTALARAVWHVSRDPDNPERRFFLAGKNNLARAADGLAFTIDGPGNQARVFWEDKPITLSADEGMRQEAMQAHDRPGPEPESRRAAETWLLALMQAAGGEVAAATVQAEGKAAGVGEWKTTQRAGDALGVVRFKQGFGGGWRWRLPTADELAAKGTRRGQTCPVHNNLSPSGNLSPSDNTTKNKQSESLCARGAHEGDKGDKLLCARGEPVQYDGEPCEGGAA